MDAEKKHPPERGGIRIAVLVSGHGRGSNMQALIDGCRDGRIQGNVVVVIGTRRGAPALERASLAGIPTLVISPCDAGGEAEYGKRLLRALRRYKVDLVCLAGYMRLLPKEVVEAYRWRIMNIHPALLPRFGGKGMYGERVHEAVLSTGQIESGCTVHCVDDEYDHGPVILQTRVPVLPGDTPDTLAARVLPEEHKTYVKAVALFSEGRLRIKNGTVRITDRAEED